MAINSPEEYDKLYKILFNKITKEEEYKKYFNKPKTLAIFFKLLQHIVKKENSKEVNYKNVF
jgi:sRNA-binding carbon storage regulator CsrA